MDMNLEWDVIFRKIAPCPRYYTIIVFLLLNFTNNSSVTGTTTTQAIPTQAMTPPMTAADVDDVDPLALSVLSSTYKDKFTSA